MPAGEPFTARQHDDIVRALRLAQQESGLRFSAFVGAFEGEPRVYAEKLHAALGPDAGESVLVAVDPGARRIEIVTGEGVLPYLDDRACALAAITMTSSFTAGDLAGGLVNGIRVLSEHARHPRTLHLDTP